MKNLLQGIEHLKKDSVLNTLIDKFGVIDYPPSSNIFESLSASIIGQQLSNKAADTIWSRFIQLFENNEVTPEAILKLDSNNIRSVGTSWAKVWALKDLSEKVSNGTIQLNKLMEMSDEEIINHLVLVKGIGKWTAEMRLMFSFGRPDILPLDDVGIQNGFVKFYQLNRTDKHIKEKMEEISQKWRPYRTIACWYLWRGLDESKN